MYTVTTCHVCCQMPLTFILLSPFYTSISSPSITPFISFSLGCLFLDKAYNIYLSPTTLKEHSFHLDAFPLTFQLCPDPIACLYCQRTYPSLNIEWSPPPHTRQYPPIRYPAHHLPPPPSIVCTVLRSPLLPSIQNCLPFVVRGCNESESVGNERVSLIEVAPLYEFLKCDPSVRRVFSPCSHCPPHPNYPDS